MHTHSALTLVEKKIITLYMIKLIEFAVKNNSSYLVFLMDVADISSISQHTKTTCQIKMKDRSNYIVPGLYRNLTNRLIYCLESKREPYQDPLIRPSIQFIHSPDNIEAESVFFDKYQINAFSHALGINLAQKI